MQQTTTRTRVTRGVVAATLALLALGGCSTNGGADTVLAGSPTTTTRSADPTTTDDTTATAGDEDDEEEAAADTTETTAGSVEDVDLAALLPTADDLGPAWELEPSEEDDDEDSEMTKALESQCKEFADVAGDDDDKGPQETVEFTNTVDDTSFKFSAGAATRVPSDAEVEQVLDAINACHVDTTMNEIPVTIDLSASTQEVDGADLALRFDVKLTLTHPSVGDLTIHSKVSLVRVGRLGAAVQGTDGLDEKVVAFDDALLDEWTVTMVDRLAAAQR